MFKKPCLRRRRKTRVFLDRRKVQICCPIKWKILTCPLKRKSGSHCSSFGPTFLSSDTIVLKRSGCIIFISPAPAWRVGIRYNYKYNKVIQKYKPLPARSFLPVVKWKQDRYVWAWETIRYKILLDENHGPCCASMELSLICSVGEYLYILATVTPWTFSMWYLNE